MIVYRFLTLEGRQRAGTISSPSAVVVIDVPSQAAACDILPIRGFSKVSAKFVPGYWQDVAKITMEGQHRFLHMRGGELLKCVF